MPFTESSIKVATSDGVNVVVLEPFDYYSDVSNAKGVWTCLERITVPAGSTSDGFSGGPWTPMIPRCGWRAAVLHDYLYRSTQRPKEECDLIFLEALEALGVRKEIRDLIYNAVRLFGQSAFDEDRKIQKDSGAGRSAEPITQASQ